jgi:hypothetical protein
MDADWLLTHPTTFAPGLLKRGNDLGRLWASRGSPLKNHGSLREELGSHAERSASICVPLVLSVQLAMPGSERQEEAHDYSARKAMIGSTLEARRAGTQLASSATAISVAGRHTERDRVGHAHPRQA